MPESEPVSPCIQVCELTDDRVCRGCGRSIEEIIAWPRLSRAQKWRVLARLADRDG